ncbi:hypothetical protein SUGI_1137790 [Cryptomeria japonica]|nr:hypothetical protein SUGI_1137790 [Cryptomeria japonica]
MGTRNAFMARSLPILQGYHFQSPPSSPPLPGCSKPRNESICSGGIRQAVATAVLAPFAVLLERNVMPRIIFTCFVFALGLLGMEKVKIGELRSRAKIVGTIVYVRGAMVMTFYKGNSSNAVSSSTHNSRSIEGAMFLVTRMQKNWAE